MKAGNANKIDHAMLLAAGLGTRMRPLTDQIPKPLVSVNSKALIDYNLEKLRANAITNAVVNVHHLADQLEAHCANVSSPKITISDERSALLDSGGGIAKALPMLGENPFIVMNCDTFWQERKGDALSMLIERFDSSSMDFLLLLAKPDYCMGYDGPGDFHLDDAGGLKRSAAGQQSPYVFAGAYICNPALFLKPQSPRFSVNELFDTAIENKRLFGAVLDGHWFHVGTVDAIAQVEEALARLK